MLITMKVKPGIKCMLRLSELMLLFSWVTSCVGGQTD